MILIHLESWTSFKNFTGLLLAQEISATAQSTHSAIVACALPVLYTTDMVPLLMAFKNVLITANH